MALRATSTLQAACRSPLKSSMSATLAQQRLRTPESSPCDSSLSAASSTSAPPSPLCLTPKFKKDMCKFLSEEHKNYNATQFTPTDESSAVWSEPLPQFPSWKDAFQYNMDAPAAAHRAVTPRSTTKAPAPSPYKVLAPQIASTLGDTMDATKPREVQMKADDLAHLKMMVNAATVIKVPVEGQFVYDASVDKNLLPSEQYALRVAANFMGVSSPAKLIADLSAHRVPAKCSPNQRSLFRYLQGAMSPGEEISLHDVVRIIAAKSADFSDEDFLRTTVSTQLDQAKLVYLDLSNADAYFASMQKSMGPSKQDVAQATYREFLAAPLRLKERWNQTDFVVVPVYQGMDQPRVMGILHTAASGRMKIENSAEFKDLAIAGLRDYYAAQPTAARREADGFSGVAELKAEASLDGMFAKLEKNTEKAAAAEKTEKSSEFKVQPFSIKMEKKFVTSTLEDVIEGFSNDSVAAFLKASAEPTAVQRKVATPKRSISASKKTTASPIKKVAAAASPVRKMAVSPIKQFVAKISPVKMSRVNTASSSPTPVATVKRVITPTRVVSPLSARLVARLTSPAKATASKIVSPVKAMKSASHMVVSPRKQAVTSVTPRKAAGGRSISPTDVLNSFLNDLSSFRQRSDARVNSPAPAAQKEQQVQQPAVISPKRLSSPRPPLMATFALKQVKGAGSPSSSPNKEKKITAASPTSVVTSGLNKDSLKALTQMSASSSDVMWL